MAAPRIRLGDLLVEAQLISPLQLEEVLTRQQDDRRRLGTLLIEAGLVSETQVTQILSQQLAVPWVSLYHIDFSRQLLNLVPSPVVERHCLVPIFVRRVRGLGQTLYVAMDDPTDEAALEQVRQHSGLPVRAMIAPPSDIRAAIRVYYGASAEPQADATESRPVPPPKPQQTPGAGRSAAPSELDIDIELEAPEADVNAPSDEHAQAHSAQALGHEQPETEPPPAPEEMASSGAAVLTSPAAISSAQKPSDVDAPTHDPTETTEPPTVAERSAGRAAQAAEADDDSVDAVESSRDTSPELTPASTRAAVAIAEAASEVATESTPPRSFTPVPGSTRVPARDVVMPQPRSGKGPRMVSLTLLDGTTINLPARNTSGEAPEPPRNARAESARPAPNAEDTADDEQLTARDLVAALRAVSHGADATEILGENVQWESMFAALLSLLLKKHMIADWEFIEEYKRV